MGNTREIDVAAVVDGARLRPVSFVVLLLGLAVATCDGFDNQALAFTAPAIAHDLGTQMSAFAPVFSAGLFGLMLGSMLLGSLADRFGRRRLLLACAAVFGLATVATPFVPDVATLMAVRFIGGLGIGGVPSVASALVGETVPARHRALFIALLLIGVPLGGFLGGLVGAWCLPRYGWVSVYWIGAGATGAVLLLCAALLPESARFLALRRRPAAAIATVLGRIAPGQDFGPADSFVLPPAEPRESAIAGLFRQGRARMTLLYWLGDFVNLLTFYFVVNWTPTLFRQAGLSAQAATLSTAAVNAGAILCGFALGPVSSRFSVRNTAAGTFIVAASGLALIALFSGDLLPMMAGAFLAGAGAIGGASALVMFGAESYPTALRSTGVGWALSAGRIGSVISPWLVAVPLGWGWQAQQIVLLPLLPAALGCAAILLSRPRMPALTPALEAA